MDKLSNIYMQGNFVCNVNECASTKCVLVVIEMKTLGFFFLLAHFVKKIHQSDIFLLKKTFYFEKRCLFPTSYKNIKYSPPKKSLDPHIDSSKTFSGHPNIKLI